MASLSKDSKPTPLIIPSGSKLSLHDGESTCLAAATETSNVNKPQLISAFGPAGSKVSVREAGENILNNFCHGYPDTDVSSIIPNFFSGKITELMDPRPNLTRKEEERCKGRAINQGGEGHEKAVFNLILEMIRQSDISPTLLAMRSLEMDMNNPVGLKRKALMAELPELNLEPAITRGEHDYIILAKDYGVIFIEVKGSTKESNVKSAEKQLCNANSIVQSVMKALTNDKQRTIPIVKLLVVPDCVEPSPAEKSPQGTYFLFKDSCENFKQKWVEVINELHQLKSTNPFTSNEFKELSQILVGIWSANAVCVMEKGVRTHHLEQKETDVSYVEQLRKIDTVVDTSNVRDEGQFKSKMEKLNPFTDIVHTTEQDIFRSCNDIKLCYLTPMQKELFDFSKQAIVHGAAGTGKSLLLLFKVLELVTTSTANILILAPTPHNIRIYNFLKANHVSVDMIEEFPPRSLECNVFVMVIEKFFNVDRDIFMNYDLTNYHVFADDAQQLMFDIYHKYDGGVVQHSDEYDGGLVEYSDVGDYIERLYDTCVQNDAYFWFLWDVVQGNLGNGGLGDPSSLLKRLNDKESRSYNIPRVYLLHVMRNTHEVIQLTNEMRKADVNAYNDSPEIQVPTSKAGHKVTSRIPIHHKLQLGTDDKFKLPFIMACLREELKSVTNPPYSLSLSSVAIIWDMWGKKFFNKHKEKITSFLTTEFSVAPQTVAEQLTSNNSSDIIMDLDDNIMSFESPLVVYICLGGYGAHHYKICTRARVSLTIIGVDSEGSRYYFEDSDNVDTVWWKPDISNDNSFVKYTCTCNMKFDDSKFNCEC